MYTFFKLAYFNVYRAQIWYSQTIEDKPSGKRKATSSSLAPVKEEVLKDRKHEYGNLDPQELLQKLSQEGIQGAKLQHTPTATSIHLVWRYILITLEKYFLPASIFVT